MIPNSAFAEFPETSTTRKSIPEPVKVHTWTWFIMRVLGLK